MFALIAQENETGRWMVLAVSESIDFLDSEYVRASESGEYSQVEYMMQYQPGNQHAR